MFTAGSKSLSQLGAGLVRGRAFQSLRGRSVRFFSKDFQGVALTRGFTRSIWHMCSRSPQSVGGAKSATAFSDKCSCCGFHTEGMTWILMSIYKCLACQYFVCSRAIIQWLVPSCGMSSLISGVSLCPGRGEGNLQLDNWKQHCLKSGVLSIKW